MNLNRPLYSKAAAALFALAISTAVISAQPTGFYLKLDGGINYIQNTDLKVSGFSGEMSLDSGYRVVATAGYTLNSWLALEIEGGYFDNEISSVTLLDRTAHMHDSSLSGVPLLANVVLRYENASAFLPYVALGAGGIKADLRIAGEHDDALIPAVQAQVGLIYKIDEQAWLEVAYRLMGNPKQEYHLRGLNVEADQVLSHFFGIGAIWKF